MYKLFGSVILFLGFEFLEIFVLMRNDICIKLVVVVMFVRVKYK